MHSDSSMAGELINTELLETLYQQYQTQPHTLNSSWQKYFQSIEGEHFAPKISAMQDQAETLPLESRIGRLIEAYRNYGHLIASVNPIALKEQVEPAQLKLENLGFTPDELDQIFPTKGILKEVQAPLHMIVESLHSIYCGSIGFEFKGFVPLDLEKWIEQRIESPAFNGEMTQAHKQMILESLNKSELFESFLHTKYVGQKRFSLEGAETLIPMLTLAMDKGADDGVEEIVLGMAHRGRLNVLSNILNKSYLAIFTEFDEDFILDEAEGTGDVKYHKGYTSNDLSTHNGKKIKVTLLPNPSHLESVDPVVEGQTRAKQILSEDVEQVRIMPILIHGDAALSGQGVIYENLQLSRLPGYAVGGTLHIVINNQIGFTTIPRDLRSTYYCTDIAKAFGLPVFHVNAEDPESCVRATLLAYEIRQLFHCDVFIDLNCYRKYGHNESDEPAFTQPIEYQLIRSKKPIRELYRDQLIQQNVLDVAVIEQMENEYKKRLHNVHSQVKQHLAKGPSTDNFMPIPNEGLLFDPFPTGVKKETLVELTKRFSTIPSSMRLHPKLEHLVKDRLNMVLEDKPIDWGMGECLAYATLLDQGVSIRISGQDCCRGTFSHRHALWVDQTSENEYFPLAHLRDQQGRFEIYNSPLSEFAVLGFEYGYSVACPQGLTIWEAQFGDFMNGAQVIIDQYLISAEQKWGQPSNLVLFLPHGYEGQGPEHSSARLERFLTLAGHDNIQIVNPTTPAQFFHVLRRQVLRPLCKPLVIFTPKGLLRYPLCVSCLEELIDGAFQEVLDDPFAPTQAKRLVLCSGRIYYDLIEKREKEKREDIVLIRIEQLYPFNKKRFLEIVSQYKWIQAAYWVQEEPQNMGAWTVIRSQLDEVLPKGISLYYIGRTASASPATGSHYRHKQEHTTILNQVFSL